MIQRSYTKILSEVCYDTEVEPELVPLSGEDLSYQTANRSNKARLDVRARGFWGRQQSSAMKEYCKCTIVYLHYWFSPFTEVWVENATNFTHDYQIYYQRNVIKSVVNVLLKSVVVNWVRSKVCFALLKSRILCLRSSRTLQYVGKHRSQNVMLIFPMTLLKSSNFLHLR